MLGLEAAAYRMCDSHEGMNHLRLQKSLYIAQMFYAGLHDAKKLVSTNFYIWKYGPVSAELYYRLREFGLRPIPYKKLWGHANLDDADSNDLEFLDFISEMIEESGVTSSELINYTHHKDGAWHKLRKAIGDRIVIAESEMAEEYKRRYPDAHSQKGQAQLGPPWQQMAFQSGNPEWKSIDSRYGGANFRWPNATSISRPFFR